MADTQAIVSTAGMLDTARKEGWTRATEGLPPVGQRVAVMHLLSRGYDTDGEIGSSGRWECCNGFVLPNMMFTFNPTHWRILTSQDTDK